MADSATAPEIAYYYPEPFWHAGEGGWVKGLLLFFDQIAILLPEYMAGRPAQADPSLVEPLQDLGLLRILQPEWFVDDAMTRQLTDSMEALIVNGAFDFIHGTGDIARLSRSRMGYSSAMQALADKVFHELRARDLAAESDDGLSVPMNPLVRSAYLMLIAQLAREAGARHQLDLQPVTNGRGELQDFQSFLELAPMPSRGQVVAFDLAAVSLNLDTVPLDDVLAFRADENNAKAHRRYMQNLREFALTLSLSDKDDRVRALADRRAELEDQAQDLRKRATELWHSPKAVATFGLGIVGAAWSLATLNPVPAVLAAMGAGVGMLPGKKTGNAYSYLFKAQSAL